jgi:SAM-dependent methyltransferase
MQVDLCCGNKKRKEAFGVDFVPGPKIDLVHDLDQAPWPLKDNSADDIFCEHGFEHVRDTVAFIRECHRVLRPDGILKIIVPHFSSRDSYANTTHLRHLSAYWYEPFINGHLADPNFCFEIVSSKVDFGEGLGSMIAKFLVRLLGQRKWEKSWAFIYPGSDVHTVLKAKKN